MRAIVITRNLIGDEMTEIQAYGKVFRYGPEDGWHVVREFNAFNERLSTKIFEDKLSAQMYVIWRVEDLAREEREDFNQGVES